MRAACAALLLAVAMSPAFGQAVAVEFSDQGNNADAGRALPSLKRHLESKAPRYLAPGQQLHVAFIALSRAGQTSWTPGTHGVRVMSDSTPARVELEFTLLDASGAQIAGGKRSLRSPDYFVADRGGDPLRYEKELLDDWLSQEFGARK